MPNHQDDGKFDDLDLIRERLRSASPVRKKPGSIASLVAKLRADIEEQRARGVPWREIAHAILNDEDRQAAIRSAYQRLPSNEARSARPQRKRKEPAPSKPAAQPAKAEAPQEKRTRFDTSPMLDTYNPDENHYAPTQGSIR